MPCWQDLARQVVQEQLKALKKGLPRRKEGREGAESHGFLPAGACRRRLKQCRFARRDAKNWHARKLEELSRQIRLLTKRCKRQKAAERDRGSGWTGATAVLQTVWFAACLHLKQLCGGAGR